MTTTIPQQTSYQTTDLNLATFLSLRGFCLAALKRNERGDGIFVFVDPERNIDSEILSFHSGALVPAQQFADKLRNLKFLVKRGGLS
jgi:hypothetical protein